MKLGRFRSAHVGLSGAFVVALTAWACSTLTHREAPGASVPPPPDPLEISYVTQSAPLPVPRVAPEHSARALTKLRPGMPRAEVDELFIGAPAHVSSGTARGDEVTCTVVYNITLPRADGGPPAPAVMTLQFDTTQPGHPLLTSLVTLTTP